MDTNVYRHLSDVDPGAPIELALLDHYRRIFEPWERTPTMAADPVVRSFFDGSAPELAEDVTTILRNVVYALFVWYAAGEIAVTEILPARRGGRTPLPR